MKTREEVEELKAQWVKDPCWDIEKTEGFEAYSDELLKFHAEMIERWNKQYERNLLLNAKNSVASRQMSQRTVISAMALQGMLSHATRYKPREGYPENWHEAIAQEAVELADALINHLVKTRP